MPPQDIAANAHAFLRSEVEAGRFRGAVLLARQGEVLLRSGYGLANEEWRIPNSPTTKFRVGSVTKTFTAAAILRLIEAGTLDLNGELGTWIGDLPQAWHSLTLHQLLTHTAGLRDHLAVPAKRTLNLTGARPVDLIGLIANEQMLFPPGTSRSYSNTGYILLGMLIEKISNRDYARHLDEEILRPLELTATGYDSHSQILPERASGYTLRDGKLRNAEYLDMSVPYSAGGLFSTVDDLLRWNTALHEDGLLKPNSYKRMIAEYPETKKEDGLYGYGLFIGKRSGYTCLSHSGGVSGFMSVLEYYPELDGSLILLSNLLDPRALQQIFERLSELLLGRAE
jgi:CubicO group peptidase (beta-lactamase class C family)